MRSAGASADLRALLVEVVGEVGLGTLRIMVPTMQGREPRDGPALPWEIRPRGWHLKTLGRRERSARATLQ